MKKQKLHISKWCILGLAVLLLTGCLIVSVGVTSARYRSEAEGTVSYKADSPGNIRLGKMVDAGGLEAVFDTTAEIGWETVDGQQTLKFAVANGTSADSVDNRNQAFSVRLVSSLGVSDGSTAPTVKLSFIGEDGNPVEITASAVRISQGTPLYSSFGDGWVYDFKDNGKELSWALKGGKLSWVDMTVTVTSDIAVNASLMQLQLSGDVLQD